MDKESVDTYVDWASNTLKDNGILVSINSHGKAGIQRASGYLHKRLALFSMTAFRSLPPGFFNTIPYEMVFKLKKSEEINTPNFIDSINVIGELIQLGLDKDLDSFSLTHITNNENIPEIFLLANKIFYEPSIAIKVMALDDLIIKHPNALSNYLYGNFFFAMGDLNIAHKYLSLSIFLGLSNFARIRAKVMLSLIDIFNGCSVKEVLNQFRGDSQESAAGLLNEIENIIGDFKLAEVQDQISRIMSLHKNKPLSFKSMATKILCRYLKLL